LDHPRRDCYRVRDTRASANAAINLDSGTAPGKQIDDEQDHRNHKQQVDQSASEMHSESNQPEHEQYRDDDQSKPPMKSSFLLGLQPE
jgi:hypothetical protein